MAAQSRWNMASMVAQGGQSWVGRVEHAALESQSSASARASIMAVGRK